MQKVFARSPVKVTVYVVLAVTEGKTTGTTNVPVLSKVPEAFTGENKPEDVIFNAQLAPSTPFTVKFLVSPPVGTVLPTGKEYDVIFTGGL